MNIGAIILAAGSSSRMGQSKQMLPVDGEPLLLKITKTVIASGIKNIVCVLGSNENEHRELVKSFPVQVISNPLWENGMGNSLKKGIKSFTSLFPDADAVIILVCDQPLLTVNHIHQLIKNHSHQLITTKSKSAIVASAYANTVGVPVLFDKTFFNILANVADDAGAKKIISAHKDQLTAVDFPDGAIDLDTPEDYTQFKNKHPRS
jgi:molybdenum cofactor cytidylyltransferase